MREIKFRAWDKDEKKMTYPTLHHNEQYIMQLNCSYIGEFNGKTYDTVKMPLMQYTGLKDKNGKEIYEGDILKEEAPRGNKYKVWREKGGLVINQFSDDFYKPIENINWWSGLSDMQTISFVEGNLKIIGNIYENPELLNQ